MVMGDLVLAEDEVGAVMRRLQDGVLQQTALHNHVLFEAPRVMYMHIGLFFMHFWANDDVVKLAKGLRARVGSDKVQTVDGGRLDPYITFDASSRPFPNGCCCSRPSRRVHDTGRGRSARMGTRAHLT
jgi:hypothetical protein